MSSEKSIVVTAYGHDQTVDKIAVSSFDGPGGRGYPAGSSAGRYCDAINGLELKDNLWICAKIVDENTQYALDAFVPMRFDVILDLDDRSIQKVLRETGSQDLAKALRGTEEKIKQKIFYNMSERAAQMLKEDIEYMGPVRARDVQASRERITAIVRTLEQNGEIVIYAKGETVI